MELSLEAVFIEYFLQIIYLSFNNDITSEWLSVDI